MGLHELKILGVKDCIVEVDSAVFVGWGLGKGDGSWKVFQFNYEVRELMVVLGTSFVHVLCEQKSFADKIAKWGVGLSSTFIGSVVPGSSS